MKYVLILLLGTLFTLASCSSMGESDGGDTSVVYQENTSSTSVEGEVTNTNKTITATTKQPENPKDAGTITAKINPKTGLIDIITSTGAALNVAGIVASVALLKIPMYMSGLLILVGVLIIIFSPMKKEGIFVAGSGAVLMALTYLLAQYSLIIMILGVVAMVVVGVVWFIRKYYINSNANKDFVKTIELLKSTGKLSNTDLKAIANAVQDKETTGKVVDKIQHGLKTKK